MRADTHSLGTPYLGRSLERAEDAALLSGRGAFGDDLGVKPGTLHAAILRAPHGHALIKSIETVKAERSAGVRAVLTGVDIRNWSQPFVVGVKQPMEHWCLAVDRVRYVGEPVAVVVAESRDLAEDALDLIAIEYEVLPVAVGIEDALHPNAPLLHPAVGSNVVSDRSYVYGNPAAMFSSAPHRIALSVRYPRNSCTPMECTVVIAEFLGDGDGYDVTSNFMGPFSLHTVMAMALKVPGTRLRHRSPRDSGGSFGVKQSAFPYVVLMCLAARKARAPVKWVEDRLEHLTAATSATGRLSTIEAAVEADGRITALSFDQIDDCGGYLRAPEPATLYRMHGCITGAYAVQHLSVRNRAVLTNKTPAGLVRGFGGPQVYFALERMVQRIAVELCIDPLDVYRRNFVPCFPYRAAAGALLDSGDYPALLALAAKDGGLDELLQRRQEARREGRLYGIGFAAIVEPSISNMGYISTVMPVAARAKAGPKNGAIACATVSIDPLGGVSVVVASTPAGQGHTTVCAQVVADIFGLTPDQIAVNIDLDTQKDAWTVAEGNYSSRFAGAVAGTLSLAATRLRDKLARIWAPQLGCDAGDLVFAGGKVFNRSSPDKTLPFARLAGSPHWAPALLPIGETPGLRETVFWTPEQLTAPDDEDRINTSAAYGFVFDICAVEVSRETGQVRIDRYITAHDAGTILNPALVDGQIRGGFAQGLGAALMEEFDYGADGSFLSGTFADYLLPTACEVPEPVILHMETPSPFTPLGAKGVGEGNNMSTPVCLANAVADALGVRDIELPLTPSKLMALIGIDDPAPSQPLRQVATAGRALAASGEVDIAARPEDVFRILLDPKALARVIPGCHALELVAPNHYRADVSVGVGLIKARYAAEIEISELDPPRRLRLSGRGLSTLGAARGTGMVTLEPTASGTRLSYDYQADVSGKIASVGGRMLQGAARIIVAQLFVQLGREACGGQAQGWWGRLMRWLGVVR